MPHSIIMELAVAGEMHVAPEIVGAGASAVLRPVIPHYVPVGTTLLVVALRYLGVGIVPTRGADIILLLQAVIVRKFVCVRPWLSPCPGTR